MPGALLRAQGNVELDRRFAPGGSETWWVGDITYVWTDRTKWDDEETFRRDFRCAPHDYSRL